MNQLWHHAIEERDEKGRNMGAVHVRVGHDDNAFVPQRAEVKLLTQAAAQC